MHISAAGTVLHDGTKEVRKRSAKARGRVHAIEQILWSSATAAKSAAVSVSTIVGMVTTTAVARVARRRCCGRSGRQGILSG